MHSPEERRLVAELRARFARELGERRAKGNDHPCLFGDIALLRVLRGNGNDLEQASSWFSRCLCTVDAAELDGVVEAMSRELDEAQTLTPLDSMLPHHEDIKQHVRAVFSAPQTSPSGDLINYISFARFDMWAMMRCMKWRHWVEYMHGATVMRMIECDRQSRAQGRLVRVVTIIDVAGCSFGMFNCPQWHVAHSRDLGSFQERVAAEIFGPVVLLNAPWLVQQVFAGALRFVPERFRHKVRLVNGDGLDDADFVKMAGGEAQLRQLLSVKDSIFDEEEDPQAPSQLVQALIPRRQAFERSLDVSPGQVVEWEFEVLPGAVDTRLGESDVAFSVFAFWKAPDSEQSSSEQLAKLLLSCPVWERITHQESIGASRGRIRGCWRATRPGVLRISWSNLHSRLRSKIVKYSVRVAEVKQATPAPASAPATTKTWLHPDPLAQLRGLHGCCGTRVATR